MFLSKHPPLAFVFEPGDLESVAPKRLALLRVPQSAPPLVLHDLLVLEQYLYLRAHPSRSPTQATHIIAAYEGVLQDSEAFGVWRTVLAYLAAVLAKEGPASVREYLQEVRDLARGRAHARRVLRDGERRLDREEGLPTARQNALLRGVGLLHPP